MTDKIKEIEIPVIHFQCSDGAVFKDKQVAQIYESKLRGDIKTCQHCEGRGKVPDIGNYKYESCFRCNGKGYLQKKEVWK